MENNWKLKLKFGQESTPYTHYTVIADGIAEDVSEEYECRSGRAVMGLKVWAESSEEAAGIATGIGEHLGFRVDRNCEIYTTDPERPPEDEPYGYDANFVPYDEI